MVLTWFSMHDAAPITSAGSDENEISGREQTTPKGPEQGIMKRANMWRAIVLSSMGETLFPYSKYVRTLVVQDLEDLLETLDRQDPQGSKSRNTISK